MKHKVGDRVKIVGDSTSHGFAIGDTVTIIRAWEILYEASNGSSEFYIIADDCEAITDERHSPGDEKMQFFGTALTGPTLWKDMTPEEKGALLLAEYEGKKIQFKWLGEFDLGWETLEYERPSWKSNVAYRVEPEEPPEVKVETVVLWGRVGPLFAVGRSTTDTHKLTYVLRDGKVDCDSVKMEPL